LLCDASPIVVCNNLGVRFWLFQVRSQEDQKIVEPGTVDRINVQNIEAGNLSNENAERRANAGADQPLSSIQAFDGVGEYASFSKRADHCLLSLLKSEVVHQKWSIDFAYAACVCFVLHTSSLTESLGGVCSP